LERAYIAEPLFATVAYVNAVRRIDLYCHALVATARVCKAQEHHLRRFNAIGNLRSKLHRLPQPIEIETLYLYRMDLSSDAKHVPSERVGDPLTNRFAAASNDIQGSSVYIIEDRPLMDGSPGFSPEFVTQEFNIGYGKTLGVNGIVNSSVSGLPAIANRTAVE
jgi:hypothetical protein